jgi:prefoldin subunit 5
MSASGEGELLAQELSVLGHKLDDLESRMSEVERVNARLEEAERRASADPARER